MSASHEPAKLANIVVPMFRAEKAISHVLTSGATSDLLIGVPEQDDCAAFKLTGEQILVFGSDYVRGPKFLLYEKGLIDNYDIGWYLAGANLSDIAAMGAVPVGLLSVVRYPRSMDDTEFAAVLRGIRDCCASVGAANVGGDIGTAERLILSASAFGMVEIGSVLRRDAARVGQKVILSGPTGLAGAVMNYYAGDHDHKFLTDREQAALLSKWRRVAPRTSHGRAFANGGASSCIDTSDGLAGALTALCRNSGVGMEIWSDRVPINSVVKKVAAGLRVDVLDLIFGDSVDFELVATVDPAQIDELERSAAEEGLSLYTIGTVVEGADPVLVSGADRRHLPGAPWTNATD